MPKSTHGYFNALQAENEGLWEVLEDSDGLISFYTLSVDTNGDYTRLTRFKAGADTTHFGAICHTYPEEVMIMSGRLYDSAVDRWLEYGEYASRAPYAIHGPFKCEIDCVVLEVSFLSQAVEKSSL